LQQENIEVVNPPNMFDYGQAMYSYLLTVPRLSVEAERAFSAAGIFATDLSPVRTGD